MEILIDNVDFWNLEAMRYYSFSKTYKGDKKAKAKELVMSGWFWGSRKMDGLWLMIIRDEDGNFHARTRTKNVNGGYEDKIDWIPHITAELNLSMPKGSAVIGELYCKDNEGSRNATSIFNCLKDKCLERQRKQGNLHFYAFDVVAWDGKSLLDTALTYRINYLMASCFNHGGTSEVSAAKYVKGQELWDLYEQVIAAGGEGIVIQHEDCVYTCGKKKAWQTLKLKKELQDTIDAFLDGDYKLPTKIYGGKEIETWPYWCNNKTGEKFNECKFNEYVGGTSTVEPITKAFYYNWATAVSFSVMKDGKPYHIGWISNIPDSMKKGIAENNSFWKNKVYEINCMEIEKIDGHYSLRHGRIVQERTDKSYLECDFSQVENNVNKKI